VFEGDEMSKAKPKGVPATTRLINPIDRKEYVPPISMRIAAEKVKDHPKPVSLSSPVKYTYHGDDK
jgi:hypothetical protein